MRKNRHNCCECLNCDTAFKKTGIIVTEDITTDSFLNSEFKIVCKLGKRVMFRKPKDYNDNDYGYIRICNDFIKLYING